MKGENPTIEHEIKKSILISEVEQKENPDGALIVRKEQLKDIVEAPLVKACENLYDKNIKTLSSSANKERIEDGEAYIFIDFETLSKKNKEKALELGVLSNDVKGNPRLKID